MDTTSLSRIIAVVGHTRLMTPFSIHELLARFIVTGANLLLWSRP